MPHAPRRSKPGTPQPISVPARAIAGILQGCAITLADRRSGLDLTQMSVDDIAAIRDGIAALDAQLWALKRSFR